MNWVQHEIPKLFQHYDMNGRGHYDRMSLNPWATFSHVIPGE